MQDWRDVVAKDIWKSGKGQRDLWAVPSLLPCLLFAGPTHNPADMESCKTGATAVVFF
jgi:hypothetical protein